MKPSAADAMESMESMVCGEGVLTGPSHDSGPGGAKLISFLASQVGPRVGRSVGNIDSVGLVGSGSVGRVGIAENGRKPLKTAKSRLPTLFCWSKRVGRSGFPTQNFLRRAARGGSVGRSDRVGNALHTAKRVGRD